MYQSAPDFDLKGLSAEGLRQVLVDRSESTCTSNSIKLLALGGIDVGTRPQTPAGVWNSAVSQFGRSRIEETGRDRGTLWVRKFDGHGSLQMHTEYGRGRNPRGLTLDSKAIGTTQTINFKGGRRLN